MRRSAMARNDGLQVLTAALAYFFKHCPDCRAQAGFDSATDEEWEEALEESDIIMTGLMEICR